MSFKLNTRLKSILLASTFSIVAPFGAVQAADTDPSVMQSRANPFIVRTIELAEAYVSGTKAMKVEEESRYGKNIYSVELTDVNGEMTDAWIDAKNGKVLGTMKGQVPDFIKKINRDWFKNVDYRVYITLEDAIVQAEKKTGFDALRADFDYDDGRDFYEVDLVDGAGKEHEIKINPLDPSIPGCDFGNDGGLDSIGIRQDHSRSHKH